jgi:demethylsterigmatocystin 6-O-methyltransferase
MVWLAERPAQLEYFNLWVGATHESQNTFLDVFPFENELSHDLQPGTPLFVDIGGGIGQQCQLLKARLPHVPGRVIVQDLPPVIVQAPVIEGIEMMAHNFMEGQPIKGLFAFVAFTPQIKA